MYKMHSKRKRRGTKPAPLLALSLKASGRSAALGRDHVDDIVDDLFHQTTIITFCHDADKWLRAGWADNQTALNAKTLGSFVNCALHALVLQRLAARGTNVLQKLRHRIKLAADFADWLALLLRCLLYTSPSPRDD